jgi:small-conductance mechanosensitive channel
MTRLLDRGLEWTLTSGLRIAFIVAGVLVGLWLYRTVTRRLQALLEGVAPSPEQAKRAATLTHIVQDVGVIALTVVAGMMVLAELGIDLKPILAAAGIGGLAIGFGAQSLVKAVIIKCRITTKPIQQWRIGREMNRRIKKTFDLRGIEIPFPHQTLYWGVAKDGTAPPLRLARPGTER